MEASDDTINVCVDLINCDAKSLASLPDHLARALVECEVVVRKTLIELEQAFIPFKEYPFEFKNIPVPFCLSCRVTPKFRPFEFRERRLI